MRHALRKFNLRYAVEEPFALRFMLAGSFANLDAELQALNACNDYPRGLLADFQHSFNQYCRTSSDTDLRNCMLSTGKYAEGLAGHTVDEAGSLGDLCNKLRDWAHAALRDVTAVSVLMLAFSGHLTTELDEVAVLGV